jgi:hypothetical protein
MQDILITPGSGEPQILFRGSGVNDTAVELNVLSSYQSATGSGTALLFEGEQGQLFAITDNLSSGVIFSVADITGLPAIEYNASGELKLGEYASNATFFKSVDFTGGTVTTSSPLIDATQTWNDGAVAFTALKLNVTDTASDASSLLMDLQVGGSRKFGIYKNGTIQLNDTYSNGGHRIVSDNTGFAFTNAYQAKFGISGGFNFFWTYLKLGFTPTNTSLATAGNATDLILERDAADTLAQRRSTNPQTFRIYNTYTDASNYERASLKWDSNLFKIGTESLGTGTARDVAIINNGNVVANFLSDRFYLGPVSDGTTVGGNDRGPNSIDLQTYRTAATQVAGPYAGIAIGGRNTATGGFVGSGWSVAIGTNNTATYESNAIGSSNTAAGRHSVCLGIANSTNTWSEGTILLGRNNSASNSIYSFATGYYNFLSSSYQFASGLWATCTRYGEMSRAIGFFAASGDAQHVTLIARNKTTDETQTNLYLNGSSTRITIPSGKIYAFTTKISGIKSDGTAAAFYTRKGCIKNVGGTTTLVGSIETIGTDIEDSATAVAITADDTNDALDIQVTGIAAETWRWVAMIEGVEIAYGT